MTLRLCTLQQRIRLTALRLHFEAVSKLSPGEQDTIISVIDGLLLKHDAQRWSQPRKRVADKSTG